MSWKDILKLQTLEQNVNFDANESCCSQLKTEFSMFIEKLDNYYFEKLGYSKGGMTNHYVRILEEPCEVVVGTILHLIDGVKNPPKGSNFPTWGLAELEKMIDNYEKCIEGE